MLGLVPAATEPPDLAAGGQAAWRSRQGNARIKHLLDMERLVRFRGAELDHAYVRRWIVDIVDMMGEEDERTQAWDQIARSR